MIDTDEKETIKQKIRISALKKVLFLPHAVRQMNRSERMVSVEEVREVIELGEVIEDYPEDVRGHSCLLVRATSSRRMVHVVCAPKEEYLTVITAYIPDEEDWDDGLRTRRKRL